MRLHRAHRRARALAPEEMDALAVVVAWVEAVVVASAAAEREAAAAMLVGVACTDETSTGSRRMPEARG
jgi:hypothetical protein